MNSVDQGWGETLASWGWDYLEGTGDLGEPEEASRVLLDAIEHMVRQGERRRLLLSNKAIDAYKQFRRDRMKIAS
jgi:hypothetical protein